METLDWHIRLIDRMLATDPQATIADYFKVTDRYNPQR